jgi:hypothetical protein
MEEYEQYRRRMEMLKKLKRKNEDEEILKNPNSLESVLNRGRKYMKYTTKYN